MTSPQNPSPLPFPFPGRRGRIHPHRWVHTTGRAGPRIGNQPNIFGATSSTSSVAQGMSVAR